jgi:type II secretion system protein L
MTLFFPSEHVALHWLEKPSAPRRKWNELLPWLLEERLLSSVDGLLFLPLAEHEHRVLVLVVARARLRMVLDQEGEPLSEAVALLPDYFALPWQENDISIADRGDGCWVVRYGLWEGFAAPAGLACALVQQILDEQAQAGLRLWIAEAELPAMLRARIATREGKLDWSNPPPLAPVLAKKANLLIREFAPRTKPVLAQWWPTSALLLLGLALIHTTLRVEAEKLRTEVALLEKRQTLTVASLFPDLNVSSTNSGSDLRSEVEQYVNWRFLQRQQLNQPVAVMLHNLDYLLHGCHCELSRLEVQASGGSLQLSADSSVEPFRLAALEVSAGSAAIRVGFTPEILAEMAAGAAP